MWMIVLQHGRSTQIHSAYFFVDFLSAHWLHFQLPVSCSLLCPFLSPSSPNTKPLPLQHPLRSAANPGPSEWSSAPGPRPRPDVETNDRRKCTKRKSSNLQNEVSGNKTRSSNRRSMTGGSSMMHYPYLFFLRIWIADFNHQAFTKDL